MPSVHILGICGTFMGSIAVLAKELGWQVTGSDEKVYPPMSTQLEQQGISLHEGFNNTDLLDQADHIIIGNVMKRGNPMVEYTLNKHLAYSSGPAWLAQHVLAHRHVLAVAGTHGKTTTSSLLAWILEYAGLKPGFLIGGVPENFGISSRLGDSQYFVIEADEYDSAFFDKRAKFVHYHPDTLILNNLEFDHADIYPDLAAIQRQFQHLIRIVPSEGHLIVPKDDQALQEVLLQDCWTPITNIDGVGAEWQVQLIDAAGTEFNVIHQDTLVGTVNWPLLGQHNVHNALAAIVAAHKVGVSITTATKALTTFRNVKRRMEIRGVVNDITVYDDFAHHPTAIATTLDGLRNKVGTARILAVLEFGSYTMRSGYHSVETIVESLKAADQIFFAQPKDWDLQAVLNKLTVPSQICVDVKTLCDNICQQTRKGDHILIMSNSGFGGIHEKILTQLTQAEHHVA